MSNEASGLYGYQESVIPSIVARPRVLVVCERSGRVRDAFAAKGCDSWSLDIEPSDQPGQHICAPAFDRLCVFEAGLNWSLIIAHPPCTFLCLSGVRWLYHKDGTWNVDRWEKMKAAIEFFRALWSLPVDRIVIENPVPHGYASRLIGKPSQYVQPYEHGDALQKKTGLWIRGLPPLVPSCRVASPIQYAHRLGPGPDRARLRSITPYGIARAMAEQWAPLLQPSPK